MEQNEEKEQVPVAVLHIAKVCHEANKALCEANGDVSQKHWNEAEAWQRESAIKGVQFALSGDHPASAQHDAWMEDKLSDGWKYGEEKDAVAKTHPCLVPYDQLPEFQQRKDHLFTAIVKSLTNPLTPQYNGSNE